MYKDRPSQSEHIRKHKKQHGSQKNTIQCEFGNTNTFMGKKWHSFYTTIQQKQQKMKHVLKILVQKLQ